MTGGINQRLLKNGVLVGMLRREDLMRWISWAGEGVGQQKP